MALIDSIRAALTQFTDEVQSLRNQIEKLLREREDLLGAPAAKADIVTVLHAWVDAQREVFLKTWGQRLQSDIASPTLDLVDPERIRRHAASNYYGLVTGNSGDLRAVDAVLAGLLGGILKSAISTAVDELKWPGEPGLPMAERAKRVAAIDAKLDALKGKESDLVQAAAQARITID
jgi:hypothetical protein